MSVYYRKASAPFLARNLHPVTQLVATGFLRRANWLEGSGFAIPFLGPVAHEQTRAHHSLGRDTIRREKKLWPLN